MKIYHICDICRQVYNITESEGTEGIIELQGICEDCSAELHGPNQGISHNNHHIWYN